VPHADTSQPYLQIRYLFTRVACLWPQVLPISKTDSIAAMLPVSQFTDDDFLVMLTETGLIKRTPLSDFETIRSNGLIAIRLRVRSFFLVPLCWPLRMLWWLQSNLKSAC
jgi:DNA gyrase C-terminal domain, beta-propeller